MNINVLPSVGGISLSELVLTQVLARQLDTERVNHAYESMKELHTLASQRDGKPYVPEGPPRMGFGKAIQENTLARLGLAGSTS